MSLKKAIMSSLIVSSMLLTVVGPVPSGVAAAQEQKQSDKKKVQINKTMAAKLQKAVKQFAGKEIKLKDVGETEYIGTWVESVDGKYKVYFDPKKGEVTKVYGALTIDKISKKDKEKALQKLKELYPNKTYEFEKEASVSRYYNDKKAKFEEHASYSFKGKNFYILLDNDPLHPYFPGYEINLDAKELEPKLLNTAAEVVKTALGQDFNLAEMTKTQLLPGSYDYKTRLYLSSIWALESNDVTVELDTKSGKAISVIHKARKKEKVKTNKEITAKDAKEVIAPLSKQLLNIDITGYEVKWDNLFKDYCFVKGTETIVRAALDADKNVVYLTSGDKAASGGY